MTVSDADELAAATPAAAAATPVTVAGVRARRSAERLRRPAVSMIRSHWRVPSVTSARV